MSMMRLMNILMLSCNKATALMEKKEEGRLNFIQNFQLVLHKSMCDACTLYEKQNHFLSALLKKQNHEPDQAKANQKSLPSEVKSTIIKELEKM